jgi:hypothetical protein
MTQSVSLRGRRALLRRILVAAGASALFHTRYSAIAALKISQKAVAYQDHPEGDKRCEKCVQFQAPNACKMVDGAINPQGYCRIFMPIRQSMLHPGSTGDYSDPVYR